MEQMDDKKRASLVFMVCFSLILLAGMLAPGNALCSDHFRCADCITLEPNCAWCNDVDVLRAFGRNSSSSSPAPLCASPEELAALNCDNIINPQSSVDSSEATSSDVSIESASVTLRPGQPGRVEMTVTPPALPPVDMYLLIDLSFTMRQNIEILRDLASDLVVRMQDLSSDFRIGYGSFVDKPVFPFADTFVSDYPCADAGISIDECEPVYSFRHVLNFTSNATELEQMLSTARFSASPDHPEAVLDAMLQSAVCENELGWRPRGESQRLIVAFTDGDYHYALDGRIGGLVGIPSFNECRLDPITHEYRAAALVDYPSSTHLSDVLNNNLITPIFAVPSAVQTVYNGLVNSIRAASVGTLSSNPQDILNLIETQFGIVSGTVVPILSPPTDIGSINVTILPVDNCGSGSLRDDSVDICTGIQAPNSVTYALEVVAGPEVCQELPQGRSLEVEVQFLRFGRVTVDISMDCDCNCAEEVENSAICNGQGTLECSTCVCNQQLGGALCECPISIGRTEEPGCSNPGTNLVCSGRGTCECGRCQCNQVEGEESTFQGLFCETDPTEIDCPRARNLPCAGNGVCVDSRCVCDEGFTGGACECTTDNSTCIPETGGGALCSGVGQCICGQCICDDYTFNFGEFCEECLPCRGSCSRVSPCVLCQVMEGRDCEEILRCEERLVINDTSILDDEFEGLKICSLREGSCEVRYFLADDITGREDRIEVFMDSTQGSLSTLRAGSSECNGSTPIWPIFVGIILGTIIVGLLVLLLWKGCTLLGDHLEYKQWEKSVRNDTERSGENPLFVDPKTEYSNPRYRAVPS